MSNTVYTIQTVDNDEVLQLDTRSKKGAAIELADQYGADHEGAIVRVVTDAGTVVYALNEALEEAAAEIADTLDGVAIEVAEPVAEDETVVSNRTKPWSRTVEAGFDAPEVEGYTLAYTRNRVKTGVYRANDKSGWLVLDTRDGNQTVVENTKQAREITNVLSATHLTETKAAAEKAKADAKVKRDEEKAAKAEAKRLADEAKAAAKAAKEAEKAAAAEAEEVADEVDETEEV